MSETVIYKGKLKPTGKTLKEFLIGEGFKVEDDEMLDTFYDNFFETYAFTGDEVYEVIWIKLEV